MLVNNDHPVIGEVSLMERYLRLLVRYQKAMSIAFALIAFSTFISRKVEEKYCEHDGCQ